jgi:hypothetical protein
MYFLVVVIIVFILFPSSTIDQKSQTQTQTQPEEDEIQFEEDQTEVQKANVALNECIGTVFSYKEQRHIKTKPCNTILPCQNQILVKYDKFGKFDVLPCDTRSWCVNNKITYYNSDGVGTTKLCNTNSACEQNKTTYFDHLGNEIEVRDCNKTLPCKNYQMQKLDKNGNVETTIPCT